MKLLIASSLLATLLSSTAMAATDEQASTINQYAPDVDVSMLSDEQVQEAFSIANGQENDAEKRRRIEFVASGDNEPMTFSDQQIAQIEEYLSPEEVMMMTGQQKGDALAIIAGAKSGDDVTGKLQALSRDVVPQLTPAETQQLMALVPGIDAGTLTQEQIGHVRRTIYNTDSDGEKRGYLESVLN